MRILLTVPTFYGAIWSSYYIEKSSGIEVGIYPRTFCLEDVAGILGSWLSHANLEHIEDNSISFLPVLVCMSIIERRIAWTLFKLIAVSGLATWLIGAPHSFHIGASALIYASYGYIFCSALLGRKILYFIPIGLAAFYYGAIYFTSMLDGLVPQEGISFAGHFGGLVSGMITGFLSNRRSRNPELLPGGGRKRLFANRSALKVH